MALAEEEDEVDDKGQDHTRRVPTKYPQDRYLRSSVEPDALKYLREAFETADDFEPVRTDPEFLAVLKE